MKIIYHHRTLGDGAEGIHIREMIKAFRELGHQVLVIGPVGEGTPQHSNSGGKLSKVKAMLPGFVFELCEIGYSFYSFIQLSWLIRKEKPDFVYDRYITFNCGSVLAAKLQRIPLFLEVNAPLALERSEQPDEKLYLKRIAFAIEKWTCSNSFKSIVVSTPLKKYLKSISVPDKQIMVMPNGVNPEKFQPHHKDTQLMQQLGIEQNDIVVGFTGVLRAWHGVEMLLEAFNKIASGHKDLFLLIVGDGPIRNELDAIISNYNLLDRVTITGRIPYEQVHNYVNLFDIAVSPKATFYASPMKVIEYMALGKPVIVPNTANFLDIIDRGENGVAFTEGDLDSFVTAMEQLINDKSLCLEMGKSARLKVENRLNWQWNAATVCQVVQTSTCQCGTP